jgi:hypothetical protein
MPITGTYDGVTSDYKGMVVEVETTELPSDAASAWSGSPG